MAPIRTSAPDAQVAIGQKHYLIGVSYNIELEFLPSWFISLPSSNA